MNSKLGNSSSWVRQQNRGRIISGQSHQNNIFYFVSSSTKPFHVGILLGYIIWMESLHGILSNGKVRNGWDASDLAQAPWVKPSDGAFYLLR